MTTLDFPEDLNTEGILSLILRRQELYAPPLPGNFYDTYILPLNEYGIQLMVKRLKATNLLPPGEETDRRNLFDTHQIEYMQMTAAFDGSGMILPTLFISNHDQGEYVTVQLFISAPIFQFKLWERRNQQIPHIAPNIRKDILDAKSELLVRLDSLFDSIHPNLVDVDFFLLDQAPWIVIFDTSHFWPDKRQGKDRMHKDYMLRQFFSSIEAQEEG